VRMFWKASSTLLASRAEVSIKERLFSPAQQRSASNVTIMRYLICHTCKLFSFLCRHSSQVSQITLVSNQHDDDIRISMVPQLLEPPCDILVSLVFADIVDKQSSHGTSVVGRRNGAISLLASGIPNLRLDRLCVYLDGSGRKLYTDG